LKETFTFLQGERIASLDHISQERIAALQQFTEERIAAMRQITEERIAAIDELHEIATAERVAFNRDIEQTGLAIVDHAAWRLAQIVAVALASSFLAGLFFLFVVRRLFFSSGRPGHQRSAAA
jgi:uncharacterized membrane protein YqiK